MAETIKIGGELESTATGNVVAAASAIKDKAKNKYQSQINAETDAELASHEGRLNAFTEGKFVTADTFSELPETGAVDTVYRVSSWDGTANSGEGAVDVTKYSEYAWENGAYKFLDVKIQVGEVFDISAYNNDTYDDLDDALSGTNVPEGVKRGGMSVKFVQSVDNKYVQYRLMAQDFTTDTTQWQGVDEKPIKGSKNLSESNGIAKVTYPINADIESVIILERGGLDTTTGAELDSSSNIQKRARSYFLQTPFTFEINGGFRIGAVLKYTNDNGVYNYISKESYPTTSPYTTKVQYQKDNYVYRVLITKEDSTQVISESEFDTIFKGFVGSYHYVSQQSSLIQSLMPCLGKVSIIGDSVSSFKDNIISGYLYYYPAGDVKNVEDTWWKQIEQFNLDNSILVNASYSGSYVIKNDVNVPSFYERCNLLGNTPDTIIVALGTNDSTYSSPLGDYDYDSAIADLSETEFIPAYTKGIKALKANYPNARIICLTFVMADAYRNAINNIARYYGITCLDCSSFSPNGHTVNNVRHPNKQGMRDIVYDFSKILYSTFKEQVDGDIDNSYPNFVFYKGSYYEYQENSSSITLHLALQNVGDYTNVFGMIKDVRKTSSYSWIYCTLPDTLPSGVSVDGGMAVITLPSNQSLFIDENYKLAPMSIISPANYKCILYNYNGAIHFGLGVGSIINRSIVKFRGDINNALSDINNALSDINQTVFSDITIERGGFDTSDGSEDNSAATKNRRVRNNGYLIAPFTLEVNNGFRIGALLRYDKTGSFVSTTTYTTSTPFVTKITIDDESYIYRVLFTKEDSTSDFTDAEVTSMLKKFSGKLDNVINNTDVELKQFSCRNAYLKRNTSISYASGTITITDSQNWDVAVVNVPASANKIKVSNYTKARFYCFNSNAANDFAVGNFNGVIPFTANTYLDIPDGTKAIAILLQKAEYPNGYGDIQIDFNDKVADNINEPSYLYSGDMIDLAKRWNIKLYKTLGTAKTVQSMAHYGDRLFMLCNSNDLVQIYIYDLNTGQLIQTLNNVDTGSLTAVHCNASFFGKEFYSGNDKYPLLYTSQWNGSRALLAYNIVENETRDGYTATLVQTITPSSSIPTSAIGEGWMDYMYNPLTDKLVAISYHIASQGYYDTENDAHVAIFDMPLISDGSSIELTTVIDSFRISPIQGRQDMTIYNSKLYLLSGFGTSEWPAYLTVIDLGNKRISNKILISSVYGDIFGEPEAADIIGNTLMVTSSADKGKLYAMNFFG